MALTQPELAELGYDFYSPSASDGWRVDAPESDRPLYMSDMPRSDWRDDAWMAQELQVCVDVANAHYEQAQELARLRRGMKFLEQRIDGVYQGMRGGNLSVYDTVIQLALIMDWFATQEQHEVGEAEQTD